MDDFEERNVLEEKTDSNLEDSLGREEPSLLTRDENTDIFLADFLKSYSSLQLDRSGSGRTKEGESSVSIVNPISGNGHRVTLSRKVYEDLNCPAYLQFLVGDKELIIGDGLNTIDKMYKISKNENCHAAYSKGLVQAIVKKFNLIYSEQTNKSSRTFANVRIKNCKLLDGATTPIAILTFS